MTSEEKLYQELRDKMLNERTRQEVAVGTFVAKAMKADPDVIEALGITADLTLKKLIPELYEKEPDSKIYEMQYKEACNFFDTINAYVNKCNLEVMEVLKDFKSVETRG